jgi:hypothetical protein
MISIPRKASANPGRLSAIFLSLMLGSVLLMNGLMGREPSKAREEKARAMAKHEEAQARADAKAVEETEKARAKAMKSGQKISADNNSGDADLVFLPDIR